MNKPGLAGQVLKPTVAGDELLSGHNIQAAAVFGVTAGNADGVNNAPVNISGQQHGCEEQKHPGSFSQQTDDEHQHSQNVHAKGYKYAAGMAEIDILSAENTKEKCKYRCRCAAFWGALAKFGKALLLREYIRIDGAVKLLMYLFRPG